MKSRKFIYPILAAIFTIGFFIYDNYVEHKKGNHLHSETETKVETTKNNNHFNLIPSSTTGDVIYHQFYTLSYHEKFEQAEWVAYELTKEHISKNSFKRPYFEQDPKVKTKSAHYANFKNSGFNKGHLCPAGDMKFSEEAFNETFYTSNVSPQLYEFNSGIWNRLEQKTRYWAEKYHSLFIVTGGVLEPNLKSIGTEHVAVPNYFYKIILNQNNSEIKAIAFLIPHKETEKGLYHFVTTIDEIEKLTGIDFFYKLPDSIENTLEASKNYVFWNLKQ